MPYPYAISFLSSCKFSINVSFAELIFLTQCQPVGMFCMSRQRFSSGFKQASCSTAQWICLFSCTMVFFLWSGNPKTLTPSLRHDVPPSFDTLVSASALLWRPLREPWRTGLFFFMNNDITESEDKWRASRQSFHSIGNLLGAQTFACAEQRAFCVVGMTTSQLIAQPGLLCCPLSVQGRCSQLLASAIWGPILTDCMANKAAWSLQNG